MLHEYLDGSISLNYRNKAINFSKLYDKVKPVAQGTVIPNERLDHIINFFKEKQEKL